MDRSRTPTIFGLTLLVTVPIITTNPQKNIYAATIHIRPLVEVERRLAEAAEVYLKSQIDLQSDLAPFCKSVLDAKIQAERDPDKFIKNLMHSYLIIKRFDEFGWWQLPSRFDIDELTSSNLRIILDENEKFLPTVHGGDVYGATVSLMRLMDIYNITSAEIVEGKIGLLGEDTPKLTGRDCIDIAKIAEKESKYVRMKQWGLEAQRLLHHPSIYRRGNFTRLMVSEILAWTYFLENDLASALKYNNMIIEDNPSNEVARNYTLYYSWLMKYNIPLTYSSQTTYMQIAAQYFDEMTGDSYAQMCRNPYPVPKDHKRKLKCFYHQSSPRLYLKPLKVTQVYENPDIFLFHDVISDKTMTRLKRIATPRLSMAEVESPEDERRLVTADYRVSKRMFLESPNLLEMYMSDQLDPIFEEISGLSMSTAEELQINNYGLGGLYEHHYDYGDPGSLISSGPYKNRIATLLLYLSDVEKGGETVFTDIGLVIPPEKGSILLWHNLYRNGSGVLKTRHGSCPVLVGSKWVANKWVHEVGNEFRRPCTLNRFD